MRARSGRMQIALTAIGIIGALVVSTMLDGWHWRLLIPAAVVVAGSWFEWRRRPSP